MAFSATDVRFSDTSMHLLAIGTDLHPPLKQRSDRSRHRAAQLQEFAGIGLQNAGDRARRAKLARPSLTRGLQQAAFLQIPTSEIVAVEVLAFLTSRSTHSIYMQQGRAGPASALQRFPLTPH